MLFFVAEFKRVDAGTLLGLWHFLFRNRNIFGGGVSKFVNECNFLNGYLLLFQMEFLHLSEEVSGERAWLTN